MTKPFHVEPILNTPNEAKIRHSALSKNGKPSVDRPIERQWLSLHIIPRPWSRRAKGQAGRDMDQQDAEAAHG
ncbi:MAG: hypothetical protein ACK4PN_03705 [Allorhizobium sp.]